MQFTKTETGRKIFYTYDFTLENWNQVSVWASALYADGELEAVIDTYLLTGDLTKTENEKIYAMIKEDLGLPY